MDTMKKDLNFIRQWCIAILQFMADEYDEKDNYKQYYLKQMEVFINPPHSNLAGFKGAYNHINQRALYETKDLQKLNAMLLEKFGSSLIDEETLIEKVIKKIVKRGRISSDEEYDLVKTYIDKQINSDSINEKLIKKLDALLFLNPDEGK